MCISCVCRIGKACAEECGVLFTETSAKTNHNVSELFRTIALRLPAAQPARTPGKGMYYCTYLRLYYDSPILSIDLFAFV